MAWQVEYTEDFEEWWSTLTAEHQERLTAGVEKLEEAGPTLGRPYVDTLTNTNPREPQRTSHHR